MTRVYVKLFIGFWFINILMIVGMGLTTHWLDLRPDKHLSSQSEMSQTSAAARLLREVVREAVNYSLDDIREGMQAMHENATKLVFIVDQYGQDLLHRPLPAGTESLLSSLSPEQPFAQYSKDGSSYVGRQVLLPDGVWVKIITYDTPDDTGLWWQLYFYNIWLPLLISILISGTACFILAKRMSRGIDIMRDATRRIAAGDLSVRIAQEFSSCKNPKRDEIAELGIEFDHMTARLDKSMQEQQRLIKDVSHELRSPLARLQFALAIAQQRCQGDAAKEMAKIKESADYLGQIISDILSMPMTDTAAWELCDTIDLKILLETLVDEYRETAACKGVTLALETPIQDALVATHGNSLIGVFENIVRNAMHYTPKATTVTIELDDSHNKYFKITVRDQGSGVPSGNLDDIFKPFFRTDEARTRSSGGYGLGLAISKRTVELHDGQIRAYNHANGGLCIEVRLKRGKF
ncbi:MAG: ATP-binding protein [Cellvibrionaceae bacterium]|nr:ATP-binding protein [Cellvibrionaceae bacterium]MCV6625029.1 ATP-binding protein [Cellvibrionaceae bacterium]